MKLDGRRALSWVVLLASIGLITWFALAHREDFRLLLELRPMLVVVLVGLQVVFLAANALRYLIVLEKCSSRRLQYWYWFRISVVGMLLNTFFPQSGNVYRSVLLKQRYEVAYTRYITGYFSLAWMSLCFNLFLALVTLAAVEPHQRLGGLPALPLLLVMLLGCVMVPVALDRVHRPFVVRIRYLAWLRSKVGEVLRITVENLGDGVYMTKNVTLALALFLHNCVLFYLAFLAMGIEVDLADLVLFYVLLQLSVYVVVTPGNLGLQELVFGLVGASLGIGMAEGILVSALVRAAGYLALAILAVPLGGMGALRSVGQYRRMDDAAK
ncbi:MAG: flippase-like domain-containing protein [Deltaproteobacteria bacterium]|nr:flippase-like domain-containing protein [Deltaproteobacteria bacterium]